MDLRRLVLAMILLLTLPMLNSAMTGVSLSSQTAPIGKNFDHLVIIAMENKFYPVVLGNGTGEATTAPFLSSLLKFGATIPKYHSNGTVFKINGCSAGCYVALTSGDDYGVKDKYPIGSLNVPNIIDSFRSAGLTYKLFCEDSCARRADHFPFLGYADTWNDSNIAFSTGPANREIVASMNSTSPANFYWFTPSDSHNMHDNNISSGDMYLHDLLVGSGTIAAPAPGSILSTRIFQPGARTELYFWWDEYDPSPNIQVGFGGATLKSGFISQSNIYDEYATLHTIEDNWGLRPLTNHDASAPITTDIFGTGSPAGTGGGRRLWT